MKVFVQGFHVQDISLYECCCAGHLYINVVVQVRHPGHLCGGDDRQGGSPALVPAQDRPLQERQCPGKTFLYHRRK